MTQEMERGSLGMKKVKALTTQWVSLVRMEARMTPCIFLAFEILDFLQRIEDAVRSH